MWLNHHSFFDTVRQEWNLPIEGYGMYKLQQKIYRTKELLKRWNREVFRNVFTTVEHAKQEAEEAEKNFDRDPMSTIVVALKLLGMGIPFSQKHAIKDCWFTVLVNGETAGFFKSTRGLRQGNTISPALFIIAAEALSKGIDHLFNGNPDMYFQAKCEVKISHLSYADDVIIFTNCKEAGLLRLMNFLRKFEEQSGQQINQAKSAFIPGRKANLLQTGSRTSLDSL
ncbi:UNVERIFIED_CONTAM: hypothetical protein Scaly_2703800 [Sesamum calycinum]|uniref:Reverse transcriptase domain-containing protein n=1 Tax=Sesamum calycinum TaxID=2727403 RepID=A0AAW2J754_9LAMI